MGAQSHVHMGCQSCFVVTAVMAVLLRVGAWHGLPEHPKATAAPPPWLTAMLGSYAQILRESPFLLHVFMLAMTTTTFCAFLGGAPRVLGCHGVTSDGIDFSIMFVPGSYIVGNVMASRLAMDVGPVRMMRWGQVLTLAGIALMLGFPLSSAVAQWRLHRRLGLSDNPFALPTLPASERLQSQRPC